MACETPHPWCKSIQLFKRNESAKVWQYRFYVAQADTGKSHDHRKSAKTSDFDQACIVAYDDYRQITNQISSGEEVRLSKETTVNDCYKFAKSLYQQDIAEGRVAASTWRSLENYYLRDLDDELGRKPIKSIDLQTWLQFKTALRNKKPHLSTRTLDYIKSAMLMCLKAGVDIGAVEELPTLERASRNRKTGKKREPLVWFNLKAQHILLRALDQYVDDKLKTDRKNEIHHAENLRDYVHLQLFTGLRTEEMSTLSFDEIKIKRDARTKTSVAVISLQPKPGRKTGGRKVVGVDGSGQAIQRIMKRRNIIKGTKDLVFIEDNKKAFRQILDKHHLRFDENGHRRTRGTLRHTFICNQICENVPQSEISIICGNSVSMIEQHYRRGLSVVDIREYKKLKAALDRMTESQTAFDANWD